MKIVDSNQQHQPEMLPQRVVSFRLRKTLKFARNNILIILIFLSILIGFGLGILLKFVLDEANKDTVLWFTLPGKLFIRALELLIVPVVFVGVVTATASLSPKNNLRITLICIGLVLLTHVAATLVGLAGSLILTATTDIQVQPATSNSTEPADRQKDTYDIISDILRNLIPKNIIKATTDQEITRYVETNVNGTITFKRSVEYIDGSNILGILTFSILLGLASSVLEERAHMFRELFKSANDVVILALRWLILCAPVGIASLIVDAVFDIQDLGESFKSIGLFTGLCVAALIFYGVIVLGAMLLIFTRSNPLKYYLYFAEPALLAFASTSGAVCIHKSLEICDNKVKMDPRLSKFTIPFYTALQADGSAIFITMSCAFLANQTGVTLTAGDYVVIMIMTSILCLCLPSVPSSSIVTILVVLNAINVPGSRLFLLYTVEWLLDRVRTAVNLYSHCFCAVITYELSKKNIGKLVEEDEETRISGAHGSAGGGNSNDDHLPLARIQNSSNSVDLNNNNLLYEKV